MNNKKVAEFGIAAIGLVGIGVWTYNRLIKKHKQLLVTLAAINKMQGNAEEAVPSQVPLSTKRTRTRTKVTRGMVKEWDMMAGKGMPHREIATMYGVSLVTVDRHLADVNRKQAVKTMKSPVCLTVPTDDAVIKQDLSIKKNHISYE